MHSHFLGRQGQIRKDHITNDSRRTVHDSGRGLPARTYRKKPSGFLQEQGYNSQDVQVMSDGFIHYLVDGDQIVKQSNMEL